MKRALERRTAEKSAAAKPLFGKRGQLLPRERIALLLDRGAPFFELSAPVGYTFDTPDPDRSIPGGGSIIGIGFVSGVRCVILASDSAIEVGSIRPMSREKMIRAQMIALENKLPYVHLVQSAGANLPQYTRAKASCAAARFSAISRACPLRVCRWSKECTANAQAEEDKVTAQYEVMSEKQIAKQIRKMEKQMHDYAKNLEFEKAQRRRAMNWPSSRSGCLGWAVPM